MFNIPNNNYTTPSEIREGVVNSIIKAFLDGDNSSAQFGKEQRNIYTPYIDNRSFHRFVRSELVNGTEYNWFTNIVTKGDKYVQFHGCELLKALKILQEHGFYVFHLKKKDYFKIELDGFMVSKKNYVNGGVLLSTATLFIPPID